MEGNGREKCMYLAFNLSSSLIFDCIFTCMFLAFILISLDSSFFFVCIRVYHVMVFLYTFISVLFKILSCFCDFYISGILCFVLFYVNINLDADSQGTPVFGFPLPA